MAGRKIRANGREYTPEEFICEWCSTPLVLDTYYTIDGKNVCQSCRNKERCASCGFLITESKYVTLDDKTYHPDCFRCCECLVELPGKFHFEDNQLYCGECILLKGGDNIEDMCAKCYMPLSGGIIKALGNRYHENCFVCHSCFGDFPNDEFVNVKGNPYCDKCIDDNSYLRSTAHLKATGQDPNASSSTRSAGGAGGYGAGNTGSGAGAGYGSGAGNTGAGGYGAGNTGAGGYGAGNTGAGAGYGSGAGNTGAGGYGAGNTGAGGYGAGNTGAGYGSGAGNTGAGGYGAGNTGSGAGGYGAGGPGGYGNNSTSRSGPEVVHKSAPPAEEYETVVENSFLNPAGLPPKGASKYDVKQKPKYGGGMKEEKRTRDYKSKAALGFSSETEHLKDMESLGYKTIRRK